MSQKFRVRLSTSLAASVTALAESWGIPVSTLLRLAVRDLVQNPERLPELVAQPYRVTESADTPQQQASARAYIEGLRDYDLSAQLGHDLVT